ncbi:hypothetical protein ACJX0J_028346 [Zea mays]
MHLLYYNATYVEYYPLGTIGFGGVLLKWLIISQNRKVYTILQIHKYFHLHWHYPHFWILSHGSYDKHIKQKIGFMIEIKLDTSCIHIKIIYWCIGYMFLLSNRNKDDMLHCIGNMFLLSNNVALIFLKDLSKVLRIDIYNGFLVNGRQVGLFGSPRLMGG